MKYYQAKSALKSVLETSDAAEVADLLNDPSAAARARFEKMMVNDSVPTQPPAEQQQAEDAPKTEDVDGKEAGSDGPEGKAQ